MAKPKKDELPIDKVIERVQAYAAGKPTAPGAVRQGPSARRVVSTCQRMDENGKNMFSYRPGFASVLKDKTISDEAKADKLCALIIPVVDLIRGLSVKSGANNAVAMTSAKNGDAEAKSEIKVETPVSIKPELDARSKPLDTLGDRAAPPRGGPPRGQPGGSHGRGDDFGAEPGGACEQKPRRGLPRASRGIHVGDGSPRFQWRPLLSGNLCRKLESRHAEAGGRCGGAFSPSEVPILAKMGSCCTAEPPPPEIRPPKPGLPPKRSASSWSVRDAATGPSSSRSRSSPRLWSAPRVGWG